MTFLGGQGGIFKSCPRVPKLRIWLLRGWGTCLKVTLQTHAPENFRLCDGGTSGHIKRAQTGSEDPHRRVRKFIYLLCHLCYMCNAADEAKPICWEPSVPHPTLWGSPDPNGKECRWDPNLHDMLQSMLNCVVYGMLHLMQQDMIHSMLVNLYLKCYSTWYMI